MRSVPRKISRVLTATLKCPWNTADLIGALALSSGHHAGFPWNICVAPVLSVTQLATTELLAPWVACTTSIETWVSQSTLSLLVSCTSTWRAPIEACSSARCCSWLALSQA